MWLTQANNLKKDNIYALQWKDEFIKMALVGQGYFDKDMNLIVDNKVNSMFFESIEDYFNSNIDTKADNAIDKTKVKINNSINIEQKALLEYIK